MLNTNKNYIILLVIIVFVLLSLYINNIPPQSLKLSTERVEVVCQSPINHEVPSSEYDYLLNSYKSVEEFFNNFKSAGNIGDIDLNNDIIKLLSGRKFMCIDVGAHLGRYSDSLLSHDICAKIVDFEPDDTIRAKLVEKFKDNTDIIIRHQLIFNKKTDITFYSCSDEQASIDKGNSINNCPGITKQAVTLQSVIDEYNPGFIKIDTEGFDDVIAMSVSDWRNVQFFYFEYNDKWFKKEGIKYKLEDVILRLSKIYHCYFVGQRLIYLNDWVASYEIMRWSNVFCIRFDLS